MAENNKKIDKNKESSNSNNMVKYVFIGLILLLIMSLGIFAVTKNFIIGDDISSNIYKNTNNGIISETVYNGLKFSNISLIKNNEEKQYTFTADVTNVSNDVIKIEQVDIILKDKDGNELITLLGDINGLEVREVKTITSSISDSTSLDKATTKEIRVHASN